MKVLIALGGLFLLTTIGLGIFVSANFFALAASEFIVAILIFSTRR